MEKGNGDDTSTEPELDTRWLKRILLPFWICRCVLLLMMGITYLAAIYWISQEVDIRGGILAATIVLILLTVFCVSLDLVSMILLGKHALKPLAFLVIQVIETTIWTVILILEIVTAIRTSQSREFLSCLSFLGLLIYASIIFHRSRYTSKLSAYISTSDRPPSYDGIYNQSTHSLAPSNPFDDTYSHSRNTSQNSELSPPPPGMYTHSRRTSSTSQFAELSPPLPGMSNSDLSTAGSQESFVIITQPENAELRSIPSNPNLYRYA